MLSTAGLAGFGLLYLLVGERCLRSSARVLAALLPAALAAWLGAPLAAVLAAGAPGLLLGGHLYPVLVFAVGAAFAGGAAWTAGGEAWTTVAAGALGGVLSLLFRRPAGILATSLLGALALVAAVQMALGGHPSVAWTGLAAGGALALLGCAWQSRRDAARPRPSPS